MAQGNRCGMGGVEEEKDVCYEGLEKVKACYGVAGGLEGEEVQGEVNNNRNRSCTIESALTEEGNVLSWRWEGTQIRKK